jgi:hypothetical protein
MPLSLMPGMTLGQQIEGTRRAIRSLRSRQRGPTWLIPSLEKRLRHLLAEQARRQKPGHGASRTTQASSKSGRARKAAR